MEPFRILIILLFCFVKTFAQSHPDKDVDSMLRNGIDKIINQKYNQAEIVFKKLDDAHPDLPLGKIYLAANSISKSYDYGIQYEEDRIENLLDSAIEISENLLDQADTNKWNNYYLALATGYSAYFEAINNSYLNAFSEGVESIEYFQTCLEIDSTFYDSYIAIGTYLYWRSAKSDFLNWIPFVEDETEEAIALLEKVVSNNSYNKHIAINSLLWIYINNKNFQKLLEMNEHIDQEFSSVRIFQWAIARSYEEFDYNLAVDVYQKIIDSLLDDKIQNHNHEIVLLHKIAMLYFRNNENSKALDYCNRILSFRIDDQWVLDQVGERVEKVKELRLLIVSKMGGNNN